MRNKYIALLTILSMFSAASVAEANPKAPARPAPRKVAAAPVAPAKTSSYASAPRTYKWYIGATGALNFVSMENSYESGDSTGDVYSFVPVGAYGGNIGIKFQNNLRIEIAGGDFGTFYDRNNYLTFALQTPYVMLNSFYNSKNAAWGGFYIGAGAGVAFPMMSLTENNKSIYIVKTDGFQQSYTGVSPVGSFMLGYVMPVGQQLEFNIGYKFSIYNGMNKKFAYDFEGDFYEETFNLGMVLNNSIEAGVRFMF